MISLSASRRLRAAATAIWPGLAARLVDARIEGDVGALERVDRQSARDQPGGKHPLGDEQGFERDRGRDLGAVDQRQPFLGAEDERLQPEPGERVARRHPLAAEQDRALADQRGAEMGERREIAGRADRPLRGDHRQGVRLEQGEQPLDHALGARRYGRGRARSPSAP